MRLRRAVLTTFLGDLDNQDIDDASILGNVQLLALSHNLGVCDTAEREDNVRIARKSR